MAEEIARYSKIRAYLITHGTTVTGIARLTGLTPGGVSMILRGDSISLKNFNLMHKIARIPEDLLPPLKTHEHQAQDD